MNRRVNKPCHHQENRPWYLDHIIAAESTRFLGEVRDIYANFVFELIRMTRLAKEDVKNK